MKKTYPQWELLLGDCLELMANLPDGSIDMILTDLPFEQTQNHWDCLIPYAPLWEQYERVIKPNGAIILFANGMFTAGLMMSNPKLWRYNLVWDKVLPSGFLNSKKMPLRSHEDICVFYKKPPIYNPQMVEGAECHSVGKAIIGWKQNQNNYGKTNRVETKGNMKYPKSILTFPKPHPSTAIHPTQKSKDMCKWLIRTYTNEWAIVFDSCSWGGTTAVASIETGRKFIVMEKYLDYFHKSDKRIEETIKKTG